ncbi:hypothetical protein YC2023_109799 [Brassica napus]
MNENPPPTGLIKEVRKTISISNRNTRNTRFSSPPPGEKQNPITISVSSSTAASVAVSLATAHQSSDKEISSLVTLSRYFPSMDLKDLPDANVHCAKEKLHGLRSQLLHRKTSQCISSMVVSKEVVGDPSSISSIFPV